MSTTRQPRFFEMNRYTSVIQSEEKNKDKKQPSSGGPQSKGICHPDGLLCSLFFCLQWCS